MLNKLLHPYTLELFQENYWEKEPLHLKQEEDDFFKDILTKQQVVDFVNRNTLGENLFTIIHRKKKLEKTALIGTLDPNTFYNPSPSIKANLRKFYNKGASIIIRNPYIAFDSVNKLKIELENYFNSPISPWIHLAKKSSKFLDYNHFDSSIFILQISGKTLISVYDSVEALTIKSRNNQIKSRALKHIFDYTLKPGDALYLPKNSFYKMKIESDSVQLGFLLQTSTYYELIFNIIEKSARQREFREICNTQTDLNFLKNKYDSIKNLFMGFAKASNSIFTENTKAISYDNTNWLNDYLEVENITSQTVIARRNSNIVCEEYKSQLSIKFKNKRISYPLNLKPIINYIIGLENPIEIESLSKIMNNEAEVLLVVRELINEGLLTIINNGK